MKKKNRRRRNDERPPFLHACLVLARSCERVSLLFLSCLKNNKSKNSSLLRQAEAYCYVWCCFKKKYASVFWRKVVKNSRKNTEIKCVLFKLFSTGLSLLSRHPHRPPQWIFAGSVGEIIQALIGPWSLRDRVWDHKVTPMCPSVLSRKKAKLQARSKLCISVSFYTHN